MKTQTKVTFLALALIITAFSVYSVAAWDSTCASQDTTTVTSSITTTGTYTI